MYIHIKKMKCYSCKSLVSGRDDMLPDINSYFQGINRGSLLYCNIMAEGFRFMPLGLVKLRSFRLSTWVS